MVKPAYCNYIAPTMVHADIIVPRGGDNKVAIQLIVQHVHSQLQLVNKNSVFVDVFWFVIWSYLLCRFSVVFFFFSFLFSVHTKNIFR